MLWFYYLICVLSHYLWELPYFLLSGPGAACRWTLEGPYPRCSKRHRSSWLLPSIHRGSHQQAHRLAQGHNMGEFSGRTKIYAEGRACGQETSVTPFPNYTSIDTSLILLHIISHPWGDSHGHSQSCTYHPAPIKNILFHSGNPFFTQIYIYSWNLYFNISVYLGAAAPSIIYSSKLYIPQCYIPILASDIIALNSNAHICFWDSSCAAQTESPTACRNVPDDYFLHCLPPFCFAPSLVWEELLGLMFL